MFRSTVNGSVLISVRSGDRTEVYDMPSLAAPDHPPRHDAGHVQQPFDVRVDHPFPVVRVALVEVLETGRQPRIVDQQVHFPETVGQRAQRAFGLKTVPDVESQHMHFHAVLPFQFVVEFLQTVGAPPGDYEVVPQPRQCAGGGSPYSRGSAGNQSCLFHNGILLIR